MTTYELKRRADLIGMDHDIAIRIRQVHIAEELAKWDDYLHQRSDYIPEMTMDEGLDEILRLQKAIAFMHCPPPENEITDEMIQSVKQIPVSNVVEFTHGRATCFAHDDKSPSAYLAKRINKLCCPVCNRMWDTIDIKVQRDGLAFHDAVRGLYAGNY